MTEASIIMSRMSKRKREKLPTTGCEDDLEEEQPPKRTKQECDGERSETGPAPKQATSDSRDQVVSDSRLATAEQDDSSLLEMEVHTRETEDADQHTLSQTGSADPDEEPLQKLEDDVSVSRDESDTDMSSNLPESESEMPVIADSTSVASFQTEDEESELADLKNATNAPILDTVDMEAAQALTILRQSASPTKSTSASAYKTAKSDQAAKSHTSVYTGSIRRKGFTKSSLAKHHLQKSAMKKLTPARSSADNDSDSQQESSSSVSPQRMVIDLQPTRKSARQAAQEDKVKPWSAMMKRGKKVKLEKRFPKGNDAVEEGKEETKKKRGRKKGSKGPALDETEVQLAKAACNMLEQTLEANAAKNNLSVVNVKNILHHVITNEHVLAMVRNSMEDEPAEDKLDFPSPSGGSPVVFEPKMTRAKLKEVSEKSGKVPFVWPVSPVKKPKPQFTELNFSDSDDEDDVEYKPSQEDLLKEESDYESTASFGSPCPSTPRSTLNTSFLEDLEEEEEVDEDEEEKGVTKEQKEVPPTGPRETPAGPSTGSPSPAKGPHIRAVAMPMGPPAPRSRGERLGEDAKFLKELDELDQEIELSEDTIAHRTRSKFPIDKPLEEIEASFVAPDITEDMFDTWDEVGEDNEEWVRWLAGLYHGPKLDPEVSDTGEDDQNDPEYNFLAEEEAVDEEDFRDDKTVQISKKEVNELLDELIDAYEIEDWAADFDMRLFDKPSQPTLSEMITAQRQAITPKEGLQKSKRTAQQQHQQQQQQQLMLFTEDERCQLQQQMQQHVQLLAQMHLLSRGNKSLEPHMNQAKLFLSELDVLAGRSEATFRGPFVGVGPQQVTYPTSAFRAGNLAGALEVTTQEVVVTEKELAAMKSNKKPTVSRAKTNFVYNPPTEGAQTLIAHSRVFAFPELLPVCSLTEKPMKTSFEKSEDVLIVLGLMQYPAGADRQTQYRMICQNMLPTKTSQQVLVHVKNVCSKSHPNVIKNWRKSGIKPTLTPPCVPVAPGNEKAPVDNFQLYDKTPEWLKKYKSAFYPKHLTLLTPVPKPDKPPQVQDPGRVTPVTAAPSKDVLAKTNQRTPSFSKLDPVSPSLGSEGQLRIRTLFPTKIAPKVPKPAGNAPSDAPQPSVLLITPQQGIISTIRGTTVKILTSSTGAVTQVLSQPSAAKTLTKRTADTRVNPTSATNVGSPDCRSVTPASSPDASPKATSTSISPSGIAALQNFQPATGERVSNRGNGDNVSSKERKGNQLTSGSSQEQVTKRASLAVDSKPSNPITNSTPVDEKASKGNSTVNATTDSKKKNFADSDSSPPSVEKVVSSSTQSSPSPSVNSPSVNDQAMIKENSSLEEEEEDVDVPKETGSPASRSKSSTPDSLIDDEAVEEDTLEDAVTSPGENILENADSNSQEVSDTEGLPIAQLGASDGITEATDGGKASRLTTKMAAKRMKTKLRRDLESTVVLLDADIVSKDPKREEREMSFSRAYLNKVKERFSSDPQRYVDFLGIFNSFSQAPKIPADEVYQKICQALEGHPDLIEDFTAFLPTDIALECGVLMENLEFARVRLFLRQVEVHFQKSPSQFQKVLGAITEWGATKERTSNDLKESILPLLKGQPHLEQEFLLLFPDERPPDNYMMDFEEIIWDDDKEKEYDSFEEIEIPDSDEEIPITKSRVGRPPNKSASSAPASSGPRPSALHRLLPKTSLLKGRLPSILKSPPKRRKYASGSKGQLSDPWQELDTRLQSGTQGCNCSCHEKSHDTWVQRKVRHCAYCSARVTRKELISSLRGFTMGCKRRAHLLTGSQQPGTSDDGTRILNPKRGSGRNPSGRKTQKVRWAEQDAEEEEQEEEEEEEEGEAPYNHAVAHLSEMCNNLADYLNENASEEDEEDEKETDVDDDDINEDDVDDDEDEDAEEGPEDDDFEDLEDEDDQDKLDDDDVVDDDDDDDEDDDGVDDVPVISEESRGIEGATPESTVSPSTSQGSHDSCLSGGSGEGKPSLQSKVPAKSVPSSQTTLLGSGVILEGNGSQANSPVTYDEDDCSTEDHMRQLKERLAQEGDGDGEGSNPSSVKSLLCEEMLPDSPVRHFRTVGREEKIDAPVRDAEQRGADSNKTLSRETVSAVPAAPSSSRAADGGRGQRSSPRRPAQTIRRVQTVRLSHSPKAAFGKSERASLFESLAKLRSSPVEGKTPAASSSSEPVRETLDGHAAGSVNAQCGGHAVPADSVSGQRQGDTSAKSTDDATDAGGSSSRNGAPGEEPPRSTGSPVCEESRADSGGAGGTLLLSAANVDRKDGEVIVWTREADRLLLQQCRDQGATQDVFEAVAETLGDKTSEQAGDRFAILMKLFQSASRDDEDSSDEDSENGEDEASADDDMQESDAHDTDEKG